MWLLRSASSLAALTSQGRAHSPRWPPLPGRIWKLHLRVCTNELPGTGPGRA